MKEIIYEERLCTGCGACFQICPQGAISMSANEEGFLFPSIDEAICNDCGLCKMTCPVNKAAAEEAVTVQNKVYACYSRDEKVREKSSSGGMFTQLALSVIQENGVVFGAGFDSDFRVRHAYVYNTQDLDDLRRSKYVQSDTGNTFREVKAFLVEGRRVFYCGTPCQIAGLKAFLGRNYPKLITCDMACSGVPSPKVWGMYLDFICGRYNSKISSISFRDKSEGWADFRMKIVFRNGKCYSDRAKRELFFIGFGKNIFNRKSCFDCKFRIANTKADITLADFWGISKQGGGEFSDNKGVSMIITHTDAGEDVLSRIGESIYIWERSLEEAVTYNPRLVSSLKEPVKHSSFFNDLSSGYSFDRLRRKYMDNESIRYRAKCLVKKVLGLLYH